MQHLTPTRIVEELNRYIIGQDQAKRAVAVAVRNRWRRRQLPPETAREIQPRNIIMVGPTGVGKTEIARRLAQLVEAPFVKIEATRFTEVGYHGRDVESMVRDLLDQALAMVRLEHSEKVEGKAQEAAAERLVDLLLPGQEPSVAREERPTVGGDAGRVAAEDSGEWRSRLRSRLRKQLDEGKLDDKVVELDITQKPAAGMLLGGMGMDQMDPDLSKMLERIMPSNTARKKVTVREARNLLKAEETDKLIDTERMTTEAIERCEQDGIIFLDEIDKIAAPETGGGGRGPDVSRQGVQRDLLPIVEGTSVTTRHGVVKTDHILFVAAGAFSQSAVSDLMPELQGRFPIRVELSALTREDFVRILTEPGNSLTMQQQRLLSVEGLTVGFDADAVEKLADYAAQANATMENIGARRLMTIVERVFEEVNFNAPERVAAGEKSFQVTRAFVEEQVSPIMADQDLSRFVL
ncbi:MAG: ATP-dependent protease ATPase subunit HslU [Phycisphaeraceae bacterium]|nr:ATP-dependent protease ATPase subunit HslU [Phycisphaeraceae bacterium]